jgi:adenosylcobyric acid synthase
MKVQSLKYQIALFIIALAPFWTSFLTRSIAWTYPLMGREGALNQMLGSAGLGFLEMDTILAREKMTTQVEAAALHFIGCSDIRVRGYHIHMGVTRRRTERPCFRITRRGQKREDVTLASADEDDHLDGAIRDGELVWGTYIHGVFDEPDFRRTWLNRVRRRKGLAPLAIDQSQALNARRSHELDRWADHLQQHIRLRPIWDGLTRRGRPHADFQSLYEDRR